MAIGDDFSVSGYNIRHISGTTVYSALEFHAWLQAKSSGATPVGDDELAISLKNPSSIDGLRDPLIATRVTLLNGANVTDNEVKYINFGSIKQANGDELYTGLRTIGSIVSNTPVYVVLNGAKLTKYWGNGHIRIMVKIKTGGALIASGIAEVFSRKWGQSYSNSEVELFAGGEASAAISTSLTDWTTLTHAQALALTGIAVTVGDVTHDMGDGNGTKLYKGTIALTNNRTIAEAAQYCQAICEETSAVSINGVPGWKYKALMPNYEPNQSAPFGAIAGGNWLVARGWLVTGVRAEDARAFQMQSDDGTTTKNPLVAGNQIGGLVSGVAVLAARDNGAGDFIKTEYTLASKTSTTVTVNEAINSDTPDTNGYIRLGEVPYKYTSVNRATKTFTINGTITTNHTVGSNVWCPFIDAVAAGSTISSPTFTFNSAFVMRLVVRKGTSPNSIKELVTTYNVGSTLTNGINATLTPDE